MAVIDPTKKDVARKLFPELSDIQFETLLAFSFLASRKSIAFRRRVSDQAVSKTLKECCDQLGAPTPEELRPIFLLRLGLYLL